MKIIRFFSLFSIALLVSFFFACPAGATESSDLKIHVNDPKLSSIVIVTTGGTIAEKADPKSGKSIPAVSGIELVKAVPGLEKVANIGVLNFMNIDSSQMTPEIWLKLSEKVNDIIKRPHIAGVVVTHGTDTMAEGAYFLELTIENIFFNQETANVLDDIHKMMKKVVFVSIAIIISLVVIFSIF